MLVAISLYGEKMYKKAIFICVCLLITVSVFVLSFTENFEIKSSPTLIKDGGKFKVNKLQDTQSTEVKKLQFGTQSKSIAVSKESCKNFVLKDDVKTCLIDQNETPEILQYNENDYIDDVIAEDAFSDEQMVSDEMIVQMTPNIDESKTTEVFGDIPE